MLNSDPGFSYVDANNDKCFSTSDGDVALVNGELQDGEFDTRVPEGNYVLPLSGAGLVINGNPIVTNTNLRYRADGNLVINTDLSTTGNIELTSRIRSVQLDDPTITAGNLIRVSASQDITSSDDTLRTTGTNSRILLNAGGAVELRGTLVQAVREVQINAGGRLLVNDSANNAGVVEASDTFRGRISLRSTLQSLTNSETRTRTTTTTVLVPIQEQVVVNVDNTSEVLTLTRFVPEMRTITETEVVSVNEVPSIDLLGATLSAGRSVAINSLNGEILGNTETQVMAFGANGQVQLTADDGVLMQSSTITAGNSVSVNSRSGEVGVSNVQAGNLVSINAARDIAVSDIVSGRTVRLNARTGDVRILPVVAASQDDRESAGTEDIRVTGPNGLINLRAGGDLELGFARINAGSSTGRVRLDAGQELMGAQVQVTGGRSVDLNSRTSGINVTQATLRAEGTNGRIGAVAGTSILGFGLGTPRDGERGGALASARRTVDFRTRTGPIDITSNGIQTLDQERGRVSLRGEFIAMNSATIRASQQIVVQASNQVLGAGANLEACGIRPSSVQVIATRINYLANVRMRASNLIRAQSNSAWLELGNASLGITTGSTTGDIRLSGQPANVTAASLVAPDVVQVSGGVGTANVTGGTVSCTPTT